MNEDVFPIGKGGCELPGEFTGGYVKHQVGSRAPSLFLGGTVPPLQIPKLEDDNPKELMMTFPGKDSKK